MKNKTRKQLIDITAIKDDIIKHWLLFTVYANVHIRLNELGQISEQAGIRIKSQLGMVVHTSNPTTEEGWKFETSLGYTVSFKPVWAT
jgi:hypothetical protein